MRGLALYDIVEQKDAENASLLQILLAVQDSNPKNYISEEDIQEIAKTLGISRSRVHSTASFYSEISLRPRGRHLIRVCGNAPCENDGRIEILCALERALGIKLGETTADSKFTLESVNCLGACYMSPAIKIDDQVFGDLTPESALELIEHFALQGGNNHDEKTI